jgi:transposase-like protein
MRGKAKRRSIGEKELIVKEAIKAKKEHGRDFNITAEKFGINPSTLVRWKKEFYEGKFLTILWRFFRLSS